MKMTEEYKCFLVSYILSWQIYTDYTREQLMKMSYSQLQQVVDEM